MWLRLVRGGGDEVGEEVKITFSWVVAITHRMSHLRHYDVTDCHVFSGKRHEGELRFVHGGLPV